MKTLAEEDMEWNPNYPVRNYEKMETCEHPNFTLIVNGSNIFFKCKSKCLVAFGERSMDEFMPRLNEYWERSKGKLTRVVEL